MIPYILKIGSFELRFYSIMIIIGLLITIFMARKRAKQLGYKPDIIENLIIIIFITALIGARLYYVIFKWNFYQANPFEIIAVWHGGLAIHGGVIGGAIGCVIASLFLKMKPAFIADVIAPWLILAQGLGRFGNFANGEAHGVPTITPPSVIFRIKPVFTDFWNTALSALHLENTPENVSKILEIIKNPQNAVIHFQNHNYLLKEYVPWGISFPSTFMPPAYLDFGTLPVHPTFFYEMILNFIAAAILYRFWRKDKWIATGGIFGLYLIFYGIIRGFVTFFRADDLMFGMLRAPHVASIIFIVIGLILFIRGRRIEQKSSLQ